MELLELDIKLGQLPLLYLLLMLLVGLLTVLLKQDKLDQLVMQLVAKQLDMEPVDIQLELIKLVQLSQLPLLLFAPLLLLLSPLMQVHLGW